MDRCGPCKFRNETKTAIKFCITCQEPQCKTCSDIHKSSKATRNHLLVHTTEFEKDSKTNKDLETLQRCNDHPDKNAEFFCIDHRHSLCSTCLLNLPKKDCKAIVETETAGEHLVKLKSREQIKIDIENSIDHCRREAEKIQKVNETSRNERQDVQRFLGDVREKIVNTFAKCEREILEKIDKDLKDQTASMSAAHDCLTKKLKVAEENKKILQTIYESGSKADVFRCVLSIIQQLNEDRKDENSLSTHQYTHSVHLSSALVTLLESIETTSIFQCTTSENVEIITYSGDQPTDLEKFLATAKHVTIKKDSGTLNDYVYSSADADTDDCSVLPKKPSQRHKAELTGDKSSVEVQAYVCHTNRRKEDINVVHESDKTVFTPDGKQPTIVDLTALLDGSIVLSDSRWSRLIRLSSDLWFKDTTDLSQTPGNITTLNERFLVVCLPTAFRVAFVSVLGEDFKWMRNFKTKHSPKGVHAVNTQRLLVSMIDHTTNKWHLHLVNTDGALIRDIGTLGSLLDSERISAFQISPDSERYYLVCCKKSNNVICFTADGSERFRHGVMSTTGLYVDKTANIYVLGSPGVLHLLSNSGKLLQAIDVPREASAITGNGDMDKIYMSGHKTTVVSVLFSKSYADVRLEHPRRMKWYEYC